jgi:hypothetical protein
LRNNIRKIYITTTNKLARIRRYGILSNRNSNTKLEKYEKLTGATIGERESITKIKFVSEIEHDMMLPPDKRIIGG